MSQQTGIRTFFTATPPAASENRHLQSQGAEDNGDVTQQNGAPSSAQLGTVLVVNGGPSKASNTPSQTRNSQESTGGSARSSGSGRGGLVAPSSSSRVSRSDSMGGGGDRMLTPAEQRRAKAKQSFEQRRAERYGFLDDIRDKQQRPPSHPDYDKRTLYVPTSSMVRFTPFEKQFWEIKKDHFDLVIFFRKGQFYELFETDAEIAARELGFQITERGTMRMAGFMYKHLSKYVSKLLAKGYKVGQVQERENRSQKDRREGTAAKGTIIERTLTHVLTSGTLVDGSMISDYTPRYLLSIKEVRSGGIDGQVRFGVCLADTSVGRFHLAELVDDARRCMLLETLLVQANVAEVLCERGNLSAQAQLMLKRGVRGLDKALTVLDAGTQFWSAEQTRQYLRGHDVFDGDTPQWPTAVAHFAASDAVMSAFGGCLFYFQDCVLDKKLITHGKYSVYDAMCDDGERMVLDGRTLANLDVLCNSDDGTVNGSLLQLFIGGLSTPFGKRHFAEQWLSHPLRRKRDIDARCDAVEDLMRSEPLRTQVRRLLKELPDLERLLARVHLRAAKYREYLQCLDGLRVCARVCEALAGRGSAVRSDVLRRLSASASGGNGGANAVLDRIFDSFDERVARRDGQIVPNRAGQSEQYDRLCERRAQLVRQCNDELEEARRLFGAPSIKFSNAAKQPYALEVPASLLAGGRQAPEHFQLVAQTKSVVRFVTPTISHVMPSIDAVDDELDICSRALLVTYQGELERHASQWRQLVAGVRDIDCLVALAQASCNMQRRAAGACRAEIVPPSEVGAAGGERAVFSARGMWHPLLAGTVVDDFIPNDIDLGRDAQAAGAAAPVSVMLITGPNMGGKSTTLRQVCVLTILAQLGCYVPARSLRLTPTDRIFTRIGADDRILAGQSTFMVELMETSTILREATEHSLVILDELGRGTSTTAGYSIAYAVTRELARRTCRTMFATHYHMLCDEFARQDDNIAANVSLYHMAYRETADDGGGGGGGGGGDDARVVFLYQLARGSCPKSFGMCVARMAGMPEEIVRRAAAIAAEHELHARATFCVRATRRLASAVEHIDGATGDAEQVVQQVKRLKRMVEIQLG